MVPIYCFRNQVTSFEVITNRLNTNSFFFQTIDCTKNSDVKLDESMTTRKKMVSS